MQRGRVVDAVAQVAHHMAAAFQGQDDAVFLRRVDAAKQVHALHAGAQRIVVERLHLGAGEHAFNGHAQLGAHMAGDALVVAGHNFDGHPAFGQSRQGLRGAGFGRVQKRGKAGKHQLTFVRHHGVRVV